MYCKICGDEMNVRYYPSKHNSLCPCCASDTPRKVRFELFNRIYFAGDRDCPESTRKEFYTDYLSSKYNLRDYMAKTISDI